MGQDPVNISDDSESDDESNSGTSETENDDSEIGSDISESSNKNVTLKINYHLADEKALSLQKVYICHMCGSE